MSRRYKSPLPGEATLLRGKRGVFGHKVMCCDCSLVHIFRHDVLSKTRMTTRAWRDERATAAARRRKK